MSNHLHAKGVGRRRFLGYSTAGATAVMLGTGAWSTNAYAETPPRQDPFTLGVASGDPAPDGVVLWTRLATEPLAADGRGGMPERRFPVQYQVSEDPGFTRIVRSGTVVASPELGHSVHPEIHGLQPSRHYWYRFRVGEHLSPVGRTRTAPELGTTPSSLNFAIASCQSYEAGFYTAYQHMAEEDLDLVVHLGDYIYEKSYVEDPILHTGEPLPDYLRTQCYDLPRYRLQYALYKADPLLQDAHAMCPWVTTFDDHEVAAIWPYVDDPSEMPADYNERKAAGFQAMYENQPLRHDQMPSGHDMRIHRRVQYGDLADFTMLDTRQYRSSHEGHIDPDATMLGGKQRDWLIDGFSSSRARWQIIGNQAPMVQIDRDVDPEVEAWYGSWDGGFVTERNLVLTEAHERGVENLVVITGDRHCNYLADLKTDFDDPDSPVVGTEIVGTSISSQRDGDDLPQQGIDYPIANPWLKFYNQQRGYCRVTLTPDLLTNEYRVMPYVSRPDAPITTRATARIEHGSPEGHLEDGTPTDEL